MSGVLVTLPLQLACQLLSTKQHVHNITTDMPVSMPTQTIDLPGGYTVFPDIGVAYKFYKNAVTWDSARQLCISEGASLATVDSFKKIEYIMEMKDKPQGTWTSFHKLFHSPDWVNVNTGQPAGYLPWRPNAFADTGLCVANRHDTLGVSPWNCNNLVPVICEIPIFKSCTNKVHLIKVD